MVALFENYFWLVASAVVPLIVPILGLCLLFRIVHDILWRG